ncbi:TetR/AcrR family transcriptional regulator [Furfurilactobacillus siliginis]|uniref:HTH tetR-type domain-containing protein n=1 Tax=Furfurilactobacillus siliginis TaxID=348151 RepID=A0A0R2L3G6_9LACO|nr:TetR/AcrR family transcriptional regulator [Furfurilactobacillus siliginis]KRN96344.1 hypothetical protein IV55_GL001306 [Furfurilactobacillus siliginis]GEK29349.1 hypothetical protein LSI01_16600 [Furfurilactobacillus siliginis]
MKLKSEALRQQILTAATTIIVNEGLTAVSTVKVAKAVKTPQSNIYSYFQNKEALLLAVFAAHQQRLIEALTSVLDETLSPKEKLHQLVTAMVQLGLAHPDTIRIILLFRQQPEWRPRLPKNSDSAFFTAIFTQFAQLQQQQIVKPYDASFLAEGVFSIITNYLIAIDAGELTTTALSQADLMTLVDDFLLMPDYR